MMNRSKYGLKSQHTMYVHARAQLHYSMCSMCYVYAMCCVCYVYVLCLQAYHGSKCSCRTLVPEPVETTSIAFPKVNRLNGRVFWARLSEDTVVRHGIQSLLLSLNSKATFSRLKLEDIPELPAAEQDLELQVRVFAEQCRSMMAATAEPHQKCMHGLTCLSLAALLRGNRIRVPWALVGIISAWAEPCHYLSSSSSRHACYDGDFDTSKEILEDELTAIRASQAALKMQKIDLERKEETLRRKEAELVAELVVTLASDTA